MSNGGAERHTPLDIDRLLGEDLQLLINHYCSQTNYDPNLSIDLSLAGARAETIMLAVLPSVQKNDSDFISLPEDVADTIEEARISGRDVTIRELLLHYFANLKEVAEIARNPNTNRVDSITVRSFLRVLCKTDFITRYLDYLTNPNAELWNQETRLLKRSA